MRNLFEEHMTREGGRKLARAGFENINVAARASMVNRTHRVVRERAKVLKERRSRVRSLWIPLAVCSALLLMICHAGWTVMGGYDLTPVGIPDSSDQFLVLVLWFLPVSMALLVTVWFRRMRKPSDRERV
ncbi:MAG: hypothetical protein ABI158_00205 [Edaphobacter sp.]